MARVRPFAAWRYARPDRDLSEVAAPPYDVISPSQREALLAKDPHNVVALELPEGPLDPAVPGNRYATGKETWNNWRAQGVLAQDPKPAVYVLEQRFDLDGRQVARRAFIAQVDLEPFDAGVVLAHEKTLPKALGDRFELLKATGANLSQVFGLYEDPSCVTDALFERVMSQDPISVATDDDGVASTLWRTSDSDVVDALSTHMQGSRIFIADGHHRYTVALAYRDLRRTQASADEPPVDPAYDAVMMALVNMDDPDLAVLPYHRIVDGAPGFDSEKFLASLSEWFDVSDPADSDDLGLLEGHERAAFLIKTRDDARPRLVVLRPDVDLDSVIDVDHSGLWKRLDVSVLQELVLWPLLGVHPNRTETLDRIRFTNKAAAAFSATAEHDVAFVLRPTGLEQLRSISLAGETMPQKSTYFYPKLPSGLVIRSAE